MKILRFDTEIISIFFSKAFQHPHRFRSIGNCRGWDLAEQSERCAGVLKIAHSSPAVAVSHSVFRRSVDYKR
jgi:hypothetical protein